MLSRASILHRPVLRAHLTTRTTTGLPLSSPHFTHRSTLHRPRSTSGEFASVQTEKERMEGDVEAREEISEMQAGVSDSWKWDVRSHIWGLLENKNIARSPRPVYHRIPNFEGAQIAAKALSELDIFKKARGIKVNPDTPQKPVRELVLAQGKQLYVPQPRLRTSFFSVLDPSSITAEKLWDVVSPAGVKRWGRALSLEDSMVVDLVVVGSVAVHPETGARVGKGEGFAELEYGMLRMLGVINSETKVVTTVHDEQVCEMVKSEALCEHDVPVDIIITPTRIIYTTPNKAKPEGILWNLLSAEKLAKIKVLRTLKEKIEKEDGVEIVVGGGGMSSIKNSKAI